MSNVIMSFNQILGYLGYFTLPVLKKIIIIKNKKMCNVPKQSIVILCGQWQILASVH